MNTLREWITSSPEATFDLGRAIAAEVRGGDVIALSGPLGSGKTQFVKGLAAGLEVDPAEPVVSPTFVLMRCYEGRLRLYHLDAYRLSGAEELDAIGFQEMCAESDAAVAIEWADRISKALPPTCWRFEFEYSDGGHRRIRAAIPNADRAAALP